MSNLAELLQEFDKPVPRYTSYPTAPLFVELDHLTYREHLEKIPDAPVSLYMHIPFCQTMCLYCGCSVILNRKRENEARYVQALKQEIALVAIRKWQVNQLHFGGGTPTKLTLADFEEIFETLKKHMVFTKQAEISIEIDPRTVSQEILKGLKAIGFNRVSFGVQDTNEVVQEAVKRRQSKAMTEQTFYWAKEIGFSEGINIDLIYGLPYQTAETFRETAETIAHLGPDRIALFSYAKVPWLKPHQKAIKDETLPSTEEKFNLYLVAREIFLKAGYIALGMDHFAKAHDSLALGLQNGTLGRNFQGFALKPSPYLLPLGITAVGDLYDGYFQNEKDLESYYGALDQGKLPIRKGLLLTEEDKERRKIIHTLMCRFRLDKWEGFDLKYREEIESLKPFIERGFVVNSGKEIVITLLGRLFSRNIVSVFDAYLKKQTTQFSKAV